MKLYRLYFNRSEDAPQVWSVDEGSHESEINVQKVICRKPTESRYDATATYPEPKAWFEVVGRLLIGAGIAVIE